MQQRPKSEPALTIEEIYAIFSRHRGAAFQLADDIQRSRTCVSQTLRGRMKSQYILEAARSRALELLAEERGAVEAA